MTLFDICIIVLCIVALVAAIYAHRSMRVTDDLRNEAAIDRQRIAVLENRMRTQQP